MTEKLIIEQAVLPIARRDFQTEITRPDGSLEFREFYDSNAVFPAYKSLMHVLQDYTDASIHVKTDSLPLAREYNAERENPNARLLMMLKDLLAENQIELSIEYIAYK